MFNKEIAIQIIEAADKIDTFEYESAGPDYLDNQQADLSQEEYTNARRVKKIIYSSSSIGYKIEYVYSYKNPRYDRKFGAVKNISKSTVVL